MAQCATVAPPEHTRWLLELLGAKFFGLCKTHADAKKNESNIYCMDCFSSLCQHCLIDHGGHKLIQVRRYVYHDVVRIQDISKLVDCSGVQPYIINSARVVFLNERPQQKPTKAHNCCETCERSLQEDYQFCSLGCKVSSALRRGPVNSAPSLASGPQTPEKHTRERIRANDVGSTPPPTSPSDVLSDLIAQDTSSDEENFPQSHFYMSTPKRVRTGRPLVDSPSPKSVLPEDAAGTQTPPRFQALMQHCAVSSRRKSPPQRSPAF